MLKGESIVCFAPDAWGDIWRNRHRLLSVLARDNKVLYVEPRTTLRSLPRRLRGGQVRLGDAFRRRIEKVRENLFVYHDPIFLPRVAKTGIGPWVDNMRRSMLLRAMRALDIVKPILWLVRPDAHDIPGTLDEKLVLYQVVDDYLSYAGVTERARERIDKNERSLASRADLVVVTADHLLEVKKHLHSRMVLVRNAVDDRTLEEGSREGPRPPDLPDGSEPIFGYIGGVTEKLDLELLLKLADRLESAGRGFLALVGPVHVSKGRPSQLVELLRARRRVIFTGQKDAALVPSFVRAFDVCLIPYRIGEQARSIDPLKLYEYLAFGKPVVSVSIPSVRPFGGLVSIAETAEQFLDIAWQAASPESPARSPEQCSLRRKAASENTWERRAEQISEAVEAALQAKRPERSLHA